MKLKCYKQIIEAYREFKERDCTDKLVKLYPDVPLETLHSIIFQEYQRKTKKTYHYHALPSKVVEYYQRYQERAEKSGKSCGFLLEIADEVDLSPALMAKLILEHHYKNFHNSEISELTFKAKISEMLKNTTLIQDRHLAAEVKLCVLADHCYGNISDVVRNCVGQEYEAKLKDELSKLGLSFIDEKQLREKGYDKTPDVKLDIPIVIDGQIINWIESKASFGDEERHREYLKDQYWSYCNRFGPGLVIYWSGYIEELNNNKEPGILIRDCLPSQISTMEPLLLVKEAYSSHR